MHYIRCPVLRRWRASRFHSASGVWHWDTTDDHVLLGEAMPLEQLVAGALSWYAAYQVHNTWRLGGLPLRPGVARSALEGALKEGARGSATAIAVLDGLAVNAPGSRVPCISLRGKRSGAGLTRAKAFVVSAPQV